MFYKIKYILSNIDMIQLTFKRLSLSNRNYNITQLKRLKAVKYNASQYNIRIFYKL